MHDRQRRRLEVAERRAASARCGEPGSWRGTSPRRPPPARRCRRWSAPARRRPGVNRSPHSSVPVVSSNSTWASQPWGTCGVEIWRTRLPPRSITSPSASARGGRSHRSLSDTSQPSAPWATWLSGAAASHMFIAPHSSDSTWPKVIQRSDSTGTTVATASATSGNMPRGPVWNSSGSSPRDEELVEGEAVRASRRGPRSRSGRCRRRSRRLVVAWVPCPVAFSRGRSRSVRTERSSAPRRRSSGS